MNPFHPVWSVISCLWAEETRNNLVIFVEYMEMIYRLINWDEFKRLGSKNSKDYLATPSFKYGSKSELLPIHMAKYYFWRTYYLNEQYKKVSAQMFFTFSILSVHSVFIFSRWGKTENECFIYWIWIFFDFLISCFNPWELLHENAFIFMDVS